MRDQLTTIIAMARRRAHRHYLAMVNAERREDWRQADKHHATLVNCERVEWHVVDLINISIPRGKEKQP